VRRANYFLANCALGAVALTSPVYGLKLSPEKLRGWWRTCHRWRKYSVYGCTLSGVGLTLMYVMVSHVGVNVFVAQAIIVPAFMAAVSYFVHRYQTFGDRDVEQRSGGRYAAVRFGGMGVSKISFYLLVSVMGVQYLFASLLVTLSLAYPTYRLNRDWAFRQGNITPETHRIRGLQGAAPPIFR
jgi:putative flippase GtrA